VDTRARPGSVHRCIKAKAVGTAEVIYGDEDAHVDAEPPDVGHLKPDVDVTGWRGHSLEYALLILRSREVSPLLQCHDPSTSCPASGPTGGS
jgi:hypothetical protein